MHTSDITKSAPVGSPLCQIDQVHGCSACCGLFNFSDISEESLTAYLRAGRERAAVSEPAPLPRETLPEACVRDGTSWICPYQGFLPGGKKPGCLHHPLLDRRHDPDLRDRSLYGARICNEYFCPAHTILDTGMRAILIAGTDGWYPYTIAIIDPVSFRWIADTAVRLLEDASRRGYARERMEAAISKSLRLHGAFLNSIGGPVFHYSMDEYRRCSRAYSLTGASTHQREVLEVLQVELLRTSG